MRITMTSTPNIALVEGRRCRVWEGVTDRAVRVQVYVAIIRVDARDDTAGFEAELPSSPSPRE
jgi:hypothetical protein